MIITPSLLQQLLSYYAFPERKVVVRKHENLERNIKSMSRRSLP